MNRPPPSGRKEGRKEGILHNPLQTKALQQIAHSVATLAALVPEEHNPLTLSHAHVDTWLSYSGASLQETAGFA